MDININNNVTEIEKNIIEKMKNAQNKIVNTKNRLFIAKYEFEKNYLENLIVADEKNLKEYIIKSTERLSYYTCLNLFNNRNMTNKREFYIDHFNLLIRWSDYNKIYKSCSDIFWLKGIYAGVYIDLLNILKYPSYLNLPKNQAQKEYIIINNICKLFTEYQMKKDNHIYKYTFLNFLFKTLNYSDMTNFILDTVKIINTNTNKISNFQIGYKKIKKTDVIIYYIKYGLVRGISYNIGMTNIDSKFLANNTIKYTAIFMNKIQSEKLQSDDNRHIIQIKDESFILTPLNKINNIYKIDDSAIVMKHIINNYINNSDKINYEIAVIIDIMQLYNNYVENLEYNNIQRNDIGLFLIHQSIPMSCVVEIINAQIILQHS